MLEDKWRTDGGTPIETAAAERSAKRKGGNKRGKNGETVQIITKDLIRNLHVPQDDPSGQSIVLSRADFQRLIQASRVPTEEERKAKMEELKRLKESLQDEVQERKNFMKMKDLNRRKNEKLSELEEEEMKKAEHLRQKAIEQLNEQEDEIKRLNELILNAKCHAIRDAQIMEKQHIRTELEAEEKRLDQMMTADCKNAIKIDEEINRKKTEDRYIGAHQIMEQIEENQQNRLLDLEEKDRENRRMQKYLEKLCEEEAEKLERKRMEQDVLREELHKGNDEIQRMKAMEKEQNKLEDLKVIEWMKKKAEREAEREKEQEAVRIEKEREVARLRALQERDRDEQAERDALRAKRDQEQAEREWRRKEAESIKQKAVTEAMLQAAREQQRDQKAHFLAVQAQRERGEFEKVLKAQEELISKVQKEEEEKKKASLNYADEVRQQIRDKERDRVSQRNAFFEEGIRLDAEAKMRRQKLEEVKRRKLQELKAAGIPEKFVNQIEKKVGQQTGLTVV
ncbi:hypothetical protein CAPTEDRAFT_170976 [Capitella teleta]|uniref:Cilia- and flagella-associated protein 45 n=1 Tax=Capitella teleta TaxID=283909 RepID=R7TUT1_CAPTE|nr:hypothetical protein CAPTEDRAFT_170976 [Capitella teleta]|eukprot:ELT97459.1 hypothetical protein CAPTEDRAFT_170976 [Capitella teleta]